MNTFLETVSLMFTGEVGEDYPLYLFLIFFIFALWMAAWTLRLRRMNRRTAKQMQDVETLLHDQWTQDPSPELSHKDRRKLTAHSFAALSRYVRNHADHLPPDQRVRLRDLAQDLGYHAYLRKQVWKRRTWDRALHIRCLANLADPQDIPTFRDVLENDTFQVCIYSAAIGLANCGHTESIPLVIKRGLSMHPPNNDMLLAVLMKFGPDGCTEALNMLTHSEFAPIISCVILDYVGHVGNAEVAGKLLELLRSHQNSDVRAHTIDAISHLGTKAMAAEVLPFMRDLDYRVRIKAVNGLEHLGGTDYLEQIAECLEDTNPWVRRSAAEALARLGEEGTECLRTYVEAGPARGTVKTVLAEQEYQRLRMRYRHARTAA